MIRCYPRMKIEICEGCIYHLLRSCCVRKEQGMWRTTLDSISNRLQSRAQSSWGREQDPAAVHETGWYFPKPIWSLCLWYFIFFIKIFTILGIHCRTIASLTAMPSHDYTIHPKIPSMAATSANPTQLLSFFFFFWLIQTMHI